VIARQWGWVKPIPNAEVALFCASVAVIMHGTPLTSLFATHPSLIGRYLLLIIAYVRQPLLLRRSYLGLLGFFFGAGG
jgi:hypothetical protein